MLTNKELLPETRNLTPDTMIYSHALKNLRALATSRGQTEHWILNTVFLFFFALAALAPRAEATWATGGTRTNYADANGTNWIAHVFTSVGTTSLNSRLAAMSRCSSWRAAVAEGQRQWYNCGSSRCRWWRRCWWKRNE